MEIKITIPQEEFENIRTMLVTRKALEATFEKVKTNGMARAIDSVNAEINGIFLKYVYENKEWQK